MTALSRIQILWTNFEGSPGYTTMYCIDPAAMILTLEPFYVALEPVLPNGVEAIVIAHGDVIESTTGALTGDWTGTVTSSALGSGGSTYAAPVGASIRWRTGAVVSGHRLNGRSFIVPLASSAFDASGALGSASLLTLKTAADNLVTDSAGNFHIWHRPGAGVGGHAAVTSALVPDEAAVLRSRRD